MVSNTFGSAIHRGFDAARLVNGSSVHCHDIRNASLNVLFVVHVKYPCVAAFETYTTAQHLLDRIDNVRNLSHPFAAEVVTDEVQCRHSPYRVCAVIPHHINLSCKLRGLTWPTPRNAVVGFVGTYTPLPSDLATAVRRVAHIVREKPSRASPCTSFYDKIDIAISWFKPGISRPAERFTNPIAFGIPTVGHSSFSSFSHYVHAQPFLCRTSTCVIDRLHGILNGSLRSQFAALHDEVIRDVHPENVARLYRSTFELTTHRSSSRRAIAPLAR